MRPTRVIYVENDPALLGILTRLLRRRSDVEILLAAGSADEVLAFSGIAQADVALLDVALGPQQMNGIDLALALRRMNPDIGIVLHSQHPIDHMDRQLPASELMGWSTIPKTGEMRVEDLVTVLKSTARGMSVRHDDGRGEAAALMTLSPRHRRIMALVASGLSNREIARRLGTTDATIRQDLTRIYRVLIPDATPADDLRTRAVLAYQQLNPVGGALE